MIILIGSGGEDTNNNDGEDTYGNQKDDVNSNDKDCNNNYNNRPLVIVLIIDMKK